MLKDSNTKRHMINVNTYKICSTLAFFIQIIQQYLPVNQLKDKKFTMKFVLNTLYLFYLKEYNFKKSSPFQILHIS